MYIITFRHHHDNIECVVKDNINLFAMASILEESKIYYKVSAVGGILMQKHFGWGGFHFWTDNLLDENQNWK